MTGKYIASERGRYPVAGHVLLGGGTSIPVVLIGFVGHAGGDDKDDGVNHVELLRHNMGKRGKYNHRWDVGNTEGRRGVEGGWDAYTRQIYRPQGGDSDIVGFYMSDLKSLFTGAGDIGRG